MAALAEQDQVPLLRGGRDFGAGSQGIFWRGAAPRPVPPVALGEDNLATAAQALALLDRAPTAADLASAATLQLAGRCQPVHLDDVDWYLDVCHNREALARFLRRVPAARGGRTLAVCAMLGDKPVSALAPFAPVVDQWWLADLDGDRAGSAARLAAALPGAAVCRHASVTDAVLAVRGVARPGDRVLVFGSFYTVADAQTVLMAEVTGG